MNTEDAFTPAQVTEVVGALHNATADKWIGAGLTLVIGAVIMKIVMQTLERLVAKLPLEKAMLGFLSAAAKIVMIFVLITTVAGQLGVPITSLVALLSLFALAVSLSVQDVLANVVSGMVILISKPFVSGNYIATEKAEGEVESIGLMYTHLITPDNKAVMIPNKELSAGQITNHTAKGYRRVDTKLRLGFEYDSEIVLDALMQAAKHAGEGHEVGKPPFVGINAYLDNAIEYVARVYVPTADYWSVYYQFLLLERQELKKKNIVIFSDSTYLVCSGEKSRKNIEP